MSRWKQVSSLVRSKALAPSVVSILKLLPEPIMLSNIQTHHHALTFTPSYLNFQRSSYCMVNHFFIKRSIEKWTISEFFFCHRLYQDMLNPQDVVKNYISFANVHHDPGKLCFSFSFISVKFCWKSNSWNCCFLLFLLIVFRVFFPSVTRGVYKYIRSIM